MSLSNIEIAYYVVASISFLGQFFVIYTMSRFPSLTTPSYLIFYTHFFIALDNFLNFPFLLHDIDLTMCKFLGFLRYFDRLGLSLTILLMIFNYTILFMEDKFNIRKLINKYKELVIFLFPILIQIIPLAFNKYTRDADVSHDISSLNDSSNINSFYHSTTNDEMEDNLCEIKNIVWLIFFYDLWFFLFVLISLIQFVYTFYHVYVHYDKKFCLILFQSSGTYITLTFISYIIHAFDFFFETDISRKNLLYCVFSLLYVVVYIFEYKIIEEYEKNNMKVLDQSSDIGSVTWDSFIIRKSNNTDDIIASIFGNDSFASSKPATADSFLSSIVVTTPKSIFSEDSNSQYNRCTNDTYSSAENGSNRSNSNSYREGSISFQHPIQVKILKNFLKDFNSSNGNNSSISAGRNSILNKLLPSPIHTNHLNRESNIGTRNPLNANQIGFELENRSTKNFENQN